MQFQATSSTTKQCHLLLGIIISEAQLEHPVSSQFLQSLIDINTNLIVVLIRFVAKTKHLKSKQDLCKKQRPTLTSNYESN